MARKARRRLRDRRTQAEPALQQDTEDEVPEFGAKLDRLRRRVRRLSRKVRPGGDTILWSRWSRSVNECAELCEQIAKSPVRDLAGLTLKYKALLWELVEDDLILDHAVRRRAIAFGRDLVALSKRVERKPPSTE